MDVNLEEAVRLFNLAIDQGYADAQNNLGLCYERIVDVNVNCMCSLLSSY